MYRQLLHRVACVILTSLIGCSTVHAQEPAASSAYPPVTLGDTQLRTIASPAVGQDYQLKIRLPAGYGTSNDRYPVLYLLDGDHAFGMATDVVQYLVYDGMPDLIVVSPAYGSKHAPPHGGNMRNRDLMFPSSYPPSGNYAGDKYLRFLKDELIPYVDGSFRTVPGDRTLWGYSLGASFALHVLFLEPTLFTRYVILDGFEDDVPELEARFAKQHADLKGMVYLGSGTPRGELFRFAQTLLSRKYSSLRVQYADMAGVNHFAIPGEGLARGLRALFNKPSAFEALLPVARTSGAKVAIARYRELKRTTANDYDFSESTLDQLGWALVEMNKLRDAIAVYALNSKLYSGSSHAQYALGSAYRRLGDVEHAMASLRRAVELNPKNERAAQWLERLQHAKH